MDRAEIYSRGRQELQKRVDAALYPLHWNFAPRPIPASSATPPRFFFSPVTVPSLVALLQQRLPHVIPQVVTQAERICQHKFDLLGYAGLDYGDPIHWRLDAVHGKEAPIRPFHTVRYLDFDQVGDSKVVWELNRHQHLVTLAKALRFTGDPKYADELFRQWKHWQNANPYPRGINWASSLEVAFRSLSWFWVYYLLEGSSLVPPWFRSQWLRTQSLNGRHLERYLSTYFSPNTHLLGEAVALFFLGTLCPEAGPSAQRWKSLGWNILLRESSRQVADDGFYFEQSVYYHVYALDLFLHAATLARMNGQELPAEFETTLLKMFEALALLARAGVVPSLGDDDGGRLFDPRRNHAQHLSDPLATGAILFGRGDFKTIAGHLREETVWLLGESGVRTWDQVPSTPPSASSAALAPSGLYLLALPDPPSQMAVTCWPQVSHGHSHSDLLSLTLLSSGNALLIDPGTFQYVGNDDERDRFRATAMHNTLGVDHLSQSEPAGPFAWKRILHATAESWIQGQQFDLFAGSHDGYLRLADPVLHRRYVVALRSGFFLVRDVMLGRAKHDFEINWRLAPELHPLDSNRFCRTGSLQGLAILHAAKHHWTQESLHSPWSPCYGKKQDSLVLRRTANLAAPAECATLILPSSDISSVSIVFSWVPQSADSAVAAYAYKSADREWVFLFAEKGKNWDSGPLASDAEFVCWQLRRGETVEVLFANGSFVSIHQSLVLSCTRTVAVCEMTLDSTGQRWFCSDPDALRR